MYWHDDGSPNEIEISRYAGPAVITALRKAGLAGHAKEVDETFNQLGSRTHTINVEDWTDEQIQAILPVVKDDRKASNMLRGVLNARKNPHGRVRNLKLLPTAMMTYLAKDAIDGWVYRAIPDGGHVALVVEGVYYVSPRSKDERPYVYMKLMASKAVYTGEDGEEEGQRGSTFKVSVSWDGHALAASASTPADLLLAEGYLKETPELRAEYDESLALFTKYQACDKKQFLVSGSVVEVATGWWDMQKRYRLPGSTKMINDEGIINRSTQLACSNEEWHRYIADSENSTKFARKPVHPYIIFFDLTRHRHCWAHSLSIKPYKYDSSLRDKLVLPEKHRELIDVLTTDIDVFVEDIIEGKSGGTPILCYGEPGLGKTLTAEVYSEVIKRPLYRVHAGDLGINVESVEGTLQQILRRAERWGAVLLLDEADVYIRRRGNDIAHNAVVAAFLRTLEYFHGLLFMTTNRVNDVDDAIASRMVAMFKYETPDAVQASAIWKIMSTQFGVPLKNFMIAQLVVEFPKSSGRDIKQLLKLTMKYCKQKKVKMDIHAFKICAMFRGIL